MATNDYEFMARWRLGGTPAVGDCERRKPLLRYLSFLLKPFFRANHSWAMAKGRESL